MRDYGVAEARTLTHTRPLRPRPSRYRPDGVSRDPCRRPHLFRPDRQVLEKLVRIFILGLLCEVDRGHFLFFRGIRVVLDCLVFDESSLILFEGAESLLVGEGAALGEGGLATLAIVRVF